MIYLFHGKNNYLSSREAKSLLDKLKDKRESQKKSVEMITIDASISPFEKVVNEVETPSFFNNHKIVFLKRPSSNNKKSSMNDWILELSERTNKGDLDLILWENQKVRSNSKIIKSLDKNVWESPELKPRSFSKWARDEIKDEKFQMENDAIDILSQRVNYDPERFSNEINKISLLKKRKITVQDIEVITPDTLEHNVWDFIDSLNSGDKEKSSQGLNSLIEQGNDPHFILSMISRNIRIMLLTKVLGLKNLSSSEIAKEIGTHPFVISKIKAKSKNIDLKRIKKIYEKLVSIDYTTKTGQIDIELALNLLISVI